LGAQAIYIACAPKSNAAYKGIDKALTDIEEKKVLKPPKYLTKVGQKDYKYPHNYAKQWVKQDYLPAKRRYYFPTEEGYEAKIKKRMEELESRIARSHKPSQGQKTGHPEKKASGRGKRDKGRTS